MIKSVSYRTTNGGATYDKQRTETYYATTLCKGDEVASYSITYSWDSSTKKSKTDFTYENNNPAASAGVNDAMIKSVSYRTTNGGSNYDKQRTETYYATTLCKGDEVASYSITYSWDSSTKKSKTDFTYEGDKLAASAGVNDAMIKSVSYRTTNGGSNYDKQRTETYYATTLGKGDEVASYSITYSWDSSTKKSKTDFTYEGDKLAASAGVNDAMIKSISYRTTNGGATYDKQRTETYYATTLGKGDEVASYSITYSWDSSTKKSRTDFTYEGNKSAASAGVNDAMIKSISYRTTNGGATYDKQRTE